MSTSQLNRPLPIPPPPPLPLDDEQDNRKKIWIIIGSVLLGLFIAFLLAFWLTNNHMVGTGAGDREGGDDVVIAQLSMQNSGTNSNTDLDANPSLAGDADVSSIGTGNNTPSAAAESTPQDAPGASTTISEDSAPNQETAFLVYDDNTQSIPTTNPQSPSVEGGPSSAGKGNLITDSRGMNPFLGDGKPAKSTVYVIDISGSMQQGNRMSRMLDALIEAIDRQKSEQKIKVIAFHDVPFPDPVAKSLYAATGANKTKVKNWLRGPLDAGGTQPTDAMLMAIAMQPEVIYFLTDGEFDPYCVEAVRDANKKNSKPCVINCIGLVEDVQNLRDIASQNKGTYWQAR
jgi:hypothetical protein